MGDANTLIDAEEAQADSIFLRQIAQGVNLRISDPLEIPQNESHSNLLCISNTKGLLFAATKDGFIVHPLKEIRQELKSSQKNSTPTLKPWRSIQTKQHNDLGERVTFLRVSDNDQRLIVGLANGRIASWVIDNFYQNPQPVQSFILQPPSSDLILIDISPNPSARPEICAVIYAKKDETRIQKGAVSIFDLRTGQHLQGISAPQNLLATSMAWSVKGKQLVLGLENGELVHFTPEGDLKGSIPKAEGLDGEYYADHILWLENEVFIVTYNLPQSSDEPEHAYETYVLLRDKNDKAKITSIRFTDPAPPFGDTSRRGHRYTSWIKAWEPMKHMLFIANTSSTDVGLLGCLSQKNDASAWQVLELEDTSRPALPFSSIDKSSDTSPVGLEIDTTAEDPVDDPQASARGEDGKNKLSAVPILLVYTNDGVLLAYHVINTDTQAGKYGHMITVGAESNQRDSSVSATKGLDTSNSMATEQTPVVSTGETAFGQASGFGSNTFGSTSTTPAFGQSAQIGAKATSPFSAFSKPNSGSTTPTGGGFGSFAAKANGGGFANFSGASSTSFGFGNTPAKENPSPSSSIFGQNSSTDEAPKPSSGFGQTSGFGAFSNAGSNPFAQSSTSAFGQTSAFGGVSTTSKESPVPAFGQPSAFGGVDSKSNESSTPAFGQTSAFGGASTPIKDTPTTAFGQSSGFGAFGNTNPPKFGQSTQSGSGAPSAFSAFTQTSTTSSSGGFGAFAAKSTGKGFGSTSSGGSNKSSTASPSFSFGNLSETLNEKSASPAPGFSFPPSEKEGATKGADDVAKSADKSSGISDDKNASTESASFSFGNLSASLDNKASSVPDAASTTTSKPDEKESIAKATPPTSQTSTGFSFGQAVQTGKDDSGSKPFSFAGLPNSLKNEADKASLKSNESQTTTENEKKEKEEHSETSANTSTSFSFAKTNSNPPALTTATDNGSELGSSGFSFKPSGDSVNKPFSFNSGSTPSAAVGKFNFGSPKAEEAKPTGDSAVESNAVKPEEKKKSEEVKLPPRFVENNESDGEIKGNEGATDGAREEVKLNTNPAPVEKTIPDAQGNSETKPEFKIKSETQEPAKEAEGPRDKKEEAFLNFVNRAPRSSSPLSGTPFNREDLPKSVQKTGTSTANNAKAESAPKPTFSFAPHTPSQLKETTFQSSSTSPFSKAATQSAENKGQTPAFSFSSSKPIQANEGPKEPFKGFSLGSTFTTPSTPPKASTGVSTTPQSSPSVNIPKITPTPPIASTAPSLNNAVPVKTNEKPHFSFSKETVQEMQPKATSILSNAPKLSFPNAEMPKVQSGKEQSMQDTFLQTYSMMEKELQILKENVKISKHHCDNLCKPALSLDIQDVADPSGWTLADLPSKSRIVRELVKEIDNMDEETQANRIRVREIQSEQTKVELKIEEIERFLRSSNDPSIRHLMKQRQLGPEHAENQEKLRKGLNVLRQTIEDLDGQLAKMREKMMNARFGKSDQMKAPSLDAIRRAIRNISSSAEVKLMELEELELTFESLFHTRSNKEAKQLSGFGSLSLNGSNNDRSFSFDDSTFPKMDSIENNLPEHLSFNDKDIFAQRTFNRQRQIDHIREVFLRARNEPVLNSRMRRNVDGTNKEVKSYQTNDLTMIFAKGTINAWEERKARLKEAAEAKEEEEEAENARKADIEEKEKIERQRKEEREAAEFAKHYAPLTKAAPSISNSIPRSKTPPLLNFGSALPPGAFDLPPESAPFAPGSSGSSTAGSGFSLTGRSHQNKTSGKRNAAVALPSMMFGGNAQPSNSSIHKSDFFSMPPAQSSSPTASPINKPSTFSFGPQPTIGAPSMFTTFKGLQNMKPTTSTSSTPFSFALPNKNAEKDELDEEAEEVREREEEEAEADEEYEDEDEEGEDGEEEEDYEEGEEDEEYEDDDGNPDYYDEEEDEEEGLSAVSEGDEEEEE